MPGLSADPAKREAQLAGLRRGRVAQARKLLADEHAEREPAPEGARTGASAERVEYGDADPPGEREGTMPAAKRRRSKTPAVTATTEGAERSEQRRERRSGWRSFTEGFFS